MVVRRVGEVSAKVQRSKCRSWAGSVAWTSPVRTENLRVSLGNRARTRRTETYLQRHVEIKRLCSFGEAHAEVRLLAASLHDEERQQSQPRAFAHTIRHEKEPT